VTTRPYEQRARAEEAERTRMRIIEAVFERLRKAPAEPVAIDRIAEMAGVARSTVYAIFGSRAGLFKAVADELAERSGYGKLIEAKHEADAREHLRAGIRAANEMLAANRDIYRALYSMDALDVEAVGGAVQQIHDERSRGMARLARRLADEGLLREGLSLRDAEHVLWMLTSFDSFDALYTGRGLSLKRTTELLIETAEHTLLTRR
jgi:AcrR family transcriptional regulator